MEKKVISKSTKPREGVRRYMQNGELKKAFDGNSRQWKQIVTLMQIGKKKNGKPAFESYTTHVPA